MIMRSEAYKFILIKPHHHQTLVSCLVVHVVVTVDFRLVLITWISVHCVHACVQCAHYRVAKTVAGLLHECMHNCKQVK